MKDYVFLLIHPDHVGQAVIFCLMNVFYSNAVVEVLGVAVLFHG
jgi:hypothetical protein